MQYSDDDYTLGRYNDVYPSSRRYRGDSPARSAKMSSAQSTSRRKASDNYRRGRKNAQHQVVQPNPGRPYQRPYSEEGEWLSFDVPLRMAPDVGRSTMSHGLEFAPTTRCIAAATQRSSEESVTIELSCIQPESDWDGLKWVHVQDSDMSLDGLNRLVYAVPGVSNAEMVLAEKILYDLKSKRTSKVTNFNVVASGIILRYDSRNEFGDEHEEDHSVTFLSIPYFLTKKRSDHLNRSSLGAQTLLESLYPYERAASQDRPQVFSLYNRDSKGELIYTSQTLVLAFANVLLTYSELPTTAIGGSVLKYVNIDGSVQRPALARVINPVGDVVHINIDPVPSYFVFLEQIKLRCLAYEDADFDQVELFFDNGDKLNATSWLLNTEKNSSAILVIRARLRPPSRPPSPPSVPNSGRWNAAAYDREEASGVEVERQQRTRRGSYSDYYTSRTEDYSSSSRPRVRFDFKSSDSDDANPPRDIDRRLPWSTSSALVPTSRYNRSEREAEESKIRNTTRVGTSSALSVGSTAEVRINKDSKGRYRTQNTFLNDSNYRLHKSKPEIYRFPDSVVDQSINKPQLMIFSGQEPNNKSEAPQEDAEPEVKTKFEWGFIWEGKYQSELRDVPALPHAPAALSGDATDPDLENPGPSIRTVRKLKSNEDNEYAPRPVILRNRHKSSRTPQQKDAGFLALEEPQSDRFRRADSLSHHAFASNSSRSRSIDSADRLALVPLKRQLSARGRRDPEAESAAQRYAAGGSSPRRDRRQRDRGLKDTIPADGRYELDRFEFVGADRRPSPPSSPSASSSVLLETRDQERIKRYIPSSFSSDDWLDTEHHYVRFEDRRSPERRSSYSRDYWNDPDELDYLEDRYSADSYDTPRRNSRHSRPTRDSRFENRQQYSPRNISPDILSGSSAHRLRRRSNNSRPPRTKADSLEDTMQQFMEDRRKLYTHTVPPFFAWGSSIQPRTDIMLPDLTKLGSILRTIDEKLDYFENVQTRKMYRRAPEMEFADLEASRASMAGIHDIYSRNHCLTAAKARLMFTSLKKQTQVVENFDMTSLLPLMSSIYDYSSRTVELFLPAMVKGRPLFKIWGALDFYHQTLRDTDLQHGKLPTETQTLELWIVQDVEQCDEIAQSIPIDSPHESQPDCWCRNRVFNSKEEAIDHLYEHHYRKMHSQLFARGLLKYFVASAIDVLPKRRLFDLLSPFEHFHSFLCDFHAQMEQIALGVATATNTLRTQLQLTVSLVESFEKYLLAHAKAAQLSAFVDRHYREKLQGLNVDPNSYKERLSRLDDELDEWCSSTLETAKKAFHEIIILSRAETQISAIELNSIGLPSIVAGLLSAAQTTVFDAGEDVVKQYSGCVANLQYQVGQHPRKKLLHHIHHLGEELASIRQTVETSKLLLRNYARTLRPESYRISTRSREILYPIEDSYLKRTYRIANRQLHTLAHLERRSQHLVAQVKRSVEILEEDHGKAILTFTIITTIFLPLSFVTSFFGMNTYDLRTMRGGQWIFWAAAVPFTTIIACIVLLMAFKGGDIVEAIGGFGNVKRHVGRLFSSVGKAADLNSWRTPKRTDTDLTLESALKSQHSS